MQSSMENTIAWKRWVSLLQLRLSQADDTHRFQTIRSTVAFFLLASASHVSSKVYRRCTSCCSFSLPFRFWNRECSSHLLEQLWDIVTSLGADLCQHHRQLIRLRLALFGR